MRTINAKGRRVLIISDTHIPYQHIDYLKFLSCIKSSFISSRDLIFHIGDEVDQHAMSMHTHDPDLPSPGDETAKAFREIHRKGGLYDLFPSVRVCESNHGSMIYRRAKISGIPASYIKPYAEALQTPLWSWKEDYLLETNLGLVYICHGKTSVSNKLCKEEGASTIQGHFHSKFEITWYQTTLASRFSMYIGALADRDSLAMAYGRIYIPKIINGVGLLSMEGVPHLIKMHLNSKGRWNGKIP